MTSTALIIARPRRFGNLCAVRWTALFNAFIFSEISSLEDAKTVKMAQKSHFRACRAHFFDFQAVFSGNFHFFRHSAAIFVYFSRCRRFRRGNASFSQFIIIGTLNVTVQRTRHLVAGTLEPIVGLLFCRLLQLGWRCHPMCHTYGLGRH